MFLEYYDWNFWFTVASVERCYCVKQFSWRRTLEFLQPEMHLFDSDSGRKVAYCRLGLGGISILYLNLKSENFNFRFARLHQINFTLTFSKLKIIY